MNEKILVVEDDDAMALLAKDGLTAAGYKVTVRSSAESALAFIHQSMPDVLVLDIQLGGISGFQLCEMLKKEAATASLPIIMLTSLAGEKQKVAGLRMGADDYVTKPFSLPELSARVEALLRRVSAKGRTQKVLRTEGIEINLDTREALAEGKPVALSKIEFGLLAVFMEKKKIVHSYSALAQTVWGDDRIATSHTITVAVSRLKEKLGKAGKTIESVPGVGYRFTE